MNEIFIKPAFKIIGIAVNTTNKNMQAMTDIGLLWQRFQQENVFDKIPEKLSTDIYEVFTDYEGNYENPYRTIIGCIVSNEANPPIGMVEKIIPEQQYRVYSVKGKLPAAIGQAWTDIWNDDQNLKRTYIADFDVYGAKAFDPDQAELEIFVGVGST